MSNAANDGPEVGSIPVANVKTTDVIRGSRMWWVALACLFVALALVWWSLPERGVTINIHFPEGHGLRADDAVRFRGIDVGRVDAVELNELLDGVDVKVMLKPFAAQLAREGTRFWIVRPELSISGISGLETAVGHKYIGLIPGGPDAMLRTEFDGLGESPPDASESGGIEIIVRGDRRHSVSAGSPLSCRGVEVGRVMSVGLSQDARHVDIRIKVFEAYEKLITTETKFWPSSGVNVDFSLTSGMKLDMESLETLARGGVSLLTTRSGGNRVDAGHVFQLYDAPEENWVEAARSVRLTDFKLRGAIPMIARWQHDGIFGDSKKSFPFVGIPYKSEDGSTNILFPADMLKLPSRGVEGTLTIQPTGTNFEPVSAAALRNQSEPNKQLVSLPVSADLTSDWLFARRDLRSPTEFENCLAVRRGGSASKSTFLDFPLDKHEFTANDANSKSWFINRFDGDKRVWHGAPVLSAKDGQVIGVLLVGDHQATIVRFDGAFHE